MPPKKKKTATVIHGVCTTDMTKDEIEKFVVLLREELDRERNDRNMLALERDKLTTFWELSKRQSDDAKCMLRKKERELEEAEERHQMEMRIYRQKVKHMLFEQNAKEADVKKETSVALNAMSDETRIEVRAMQNENYTLKAQLRYKQLESEESIKMLKRQHETEMTNIRQEFIVQAEEMEQREAKKATVLREKLETKRLAELHATEERKNLHIKQLELSHDKAFSNMKSYYNDITLGNVNVIKTLRENIEELRSNLTRTQKELDTSAAETEMHRERLRQMESQNKSLMKIGRIYEAEKAAHCITKANFKKAIDSQKRTEMLYDLVQLRVEVLEKNRDNLSEQMEKILLGIKQKASFRSLMLEQKLKTLVAALESRQGQVDHMIIALNADPVAVADARKHLEDLLAQKNNVIKDLQFEVARIGKAYNELWGTCHKKLMEEFSNPVNLGIEPIKVKTDLISPFNSATAQAKLFNLQKSKDGNVASVILGKGPLGLTSVPPL